MERPEPVTSGGERNGEAQGPRLVIPGGGAVVPLGRVRQVPAVDIHGFKAALMADVRRKAFLALIGEDGKPLDIPAEVAPGAMVAIIPPETAQHLRAGLPAPLRALIPVV